MRRLIAVVSIVLVGAAASGCTKVFETTGFDPGWSPYLDTQMHPGWGGNSPTVCYGRASDVPGRQDHCRVIRGYEDGSGGWPDDNRNWIIDYDSDWTREGPLTYWTAPGSPRVGQHPIHACPSNMTIDPYGCSILVDPNDIFDGNHLQAKFWVFEGCSYSVSANAYACDYRSRHMKIQGPGGSDQFNYLRATIDYAQYIRNTAICAYNLFWIIVNNPMLNACSDGPYSGHLQDGTGDGPVDDGGKSVQTETSKVIVR